MSDHALFACPDSQVLSRPLLTEAILFSNELHDIRKGRAIRKYVFHWGYATVVDEGGTTLVLEAGILFSVSICLSIALGLMATDFVVLWVL